MAEEVIQTAPTYKDAHWTEYLLSKLDPDELVEGKFPKVDSLRRLVENYIGEISNVNTSVIQSPNDANGKTAVVLVNIGIQKLGGGYRTYSGCADASIRNCDPPFNQFPTAMAETRAFGRACRQALRITTVAAEEVSKNAEETVDIPENDVPITDHQIKGIEKLSKDLDINLEQFVNAGEYQYVSIKQVTRNKGTAIMKTLNEFKNGKRKEVPEKLRGFIKDWRNTFASE